MPRRALSVTLDVQNIRWLKGQHVAGRTRGVSETLNRIVSQARLGGAVNDSSIRSVVGTIEAHPDDPDLDQADRTVRALFDASLRRPAVARESAGMTRARKGTPRRG
jgi:hypothetical protein